MSTVTFQLHAAISHLPSAICHPNAAGNGAWRKIKTAMILFDYSIVLLSWAQDHREMDVSEAFELENSWTSGPIGMNKVFVNDLENSWTNEVFDPAPEEFSRVKDVVQSRTGSHEIEETTKSSSSRFGSDLEWLTFVRCFEKTTH
jgi:hypothetical protein